MQEAGIVSLFRTNTLGKGNNSLILQPIIMASIEKNTKNLVSNQRKGTDNSEFKIVEKATGNHPTIFPNHN